MQLVVGVLTLSIAVVAPLWAARVVLIGIVNAIAAERGRASMSEPQPRS